MKCMMNCIFDVYFRYAGVPIKRNLVLQLPPLSRQRWCSLWRLRMRRAPFFAKGESCWLGFNSTPEVFLQFVTVVVVMLMCGACTNNI